MHIQQWEYKRTPGTSNDNLNKEAKEGWELVTVSHDDDGYGYAYWKRPYNVG